MDGVLLVLLIFSMALLLLLYAFNTVRRTSKLDVIYDKLLPRAPNTVAFCIGYSANSTPDRPRFDNAVTDAKGRWIVKRGENWPITQAGTYTVLREHGRVVDRTNGFEVSGMGAFDCPDGYEGPRCRLRPLCPNSGKDEYLPIDATHFNALGLYGPTNTDTVETRRATEDEERNAGLYHERIRVHCSSDGTYRLEACPDNKLLDPETVTCRTYDVCQDRRQDYKHRYTIRDGDEPLATNEYYLCENGRSVKQTCAEGFEFSVARSTCVSSNPCFGKGIVTLPLSDGRGYVQCANDTGTTIDCGDLGVNTEIPDRLRCNVPQETCKPGVFTASTQNLVYPYGSTACVNNAPVYTICDRTLGKHVWRYRWGDEFEVSIPWPVEIWDETKNACRASDWDSDSKTIVKNPVISIKWSEAMPDPHDYDILKEQFVCAADQFRWDYLRGMSSPPFDPDTQFLETAAPCQSAVENRNDLPFYGTDSLVFPENAVPLLIGRFQPAPKYDSRWPTYDATEKKFQIQRLLLDYEKKTAVIRTFRNESAPIGFRLDSENNRVVLIGYESFDPTKYRDQYAWYTISTGKFDVPRFAPTDEEEAVFKHEDVMVKLNSTVDSSVLGKYTVAPAFLTGELAIGDAIKFGPRESKIGDRTVTAPLFILRVRRRSDAPSNVVSTISVLNKSVELTTHQIYRFYTDPE